MGVSFCPNTSPAVWRVRFNALTPVESRSSLPAFRNLGRGVF
jgi:hypothetical protein